MIKRSQVIVFIIDVDLLFIQNIIRTIYIYSEETTEFLLLYHVQQESVLLLLDIYIYVISLYVGM